MIRWWITTNKFTKYICCCFKEEVIVETPWEKMNPGQRKQRINRLWVKARFVHHFIKFKSREMQKTQHGHLYQVSEFDDDMEIDLQNIN